MDRQPLRTIVKALARLPILSLLEGNLPKMPNDNAVFILEAPWELDDSDANRSSVLPFVEGIAKLSGNTDVYHATFYDKKSFEKALACLCKSRFESAIVYVAAHGWKDRIGSVKILDLLCAIGVMSKACNISGVMLGGCYVGSKTETMKVCIEGTNLAWCAGYASSCGWLPGTMLDCSIIAKMLDASREDLSNQSSMNGLFMEALAPFSDTYQIGEDFNDEPVALRDSLQIVTQPYGKGHRAKTVTEQIFAEWDDVQLIYEEGAC